MEHIEKRFPADTRMDTDTFLNNKKIDGELYAYLQMISYADKSKRTVVDKKKMPKQTEICDVLGIKSTKTLRSHLQELINTGYVIEEDTLYILPNKEDVFFNIPLKTLQYLNDTVKEQVIKAYIYLGQRFKYKPGYVFTAVELAEHIGLKLNNNSRSYVAINNILESLQINGLIDYVEFYEGNKPKKRLTGFSFYQKQVKSTSQKQVKNTSQS